jgi:aminoglycoside 6-adenylyltransferase
VENIKSFTNKDEWLEHFGERLIMQKPVDWYSHPYDYNSNKEFIYLMQFKDGNRIDLTLVDIENMQERINDTEPRIILFNKDGIDGLHNIEVENYYYIKRPCAEEFIDCCNEFWWLSVNVAKGLCREELMYVKFFMEHYEMDMFLKMLNWKIGIDYNFSVSTGKCYKYFKRYLSESDMNRFTSIFPNGTFDDIWNKLFEMCKFFHETAIEVATYFKFKYCSEEAENIMDYLKTLC